MVQKNSLDKILIICGPTASGKSSLGVECAKLLNSAVISADSMNVYKDLNVGTAKPTEKEMQGVKHYLINVVDYDKTFSVGDYREMALPIIEELIQNGKIPVIVGGTGFYINSILFDYSYGLVKADNLVREKYNELAKKFGNEYVYNILKEKDYNASLTIHCNDLKRVIRALEIAENGHKKSEIIDAKTLKYDAKIYSFDYNRDELYNRIDKRVDSMIENGLIDEVKSLIEKNVDLSYQCMQGIGYKEIYSYLNNEISLDVAIEKIKLNTRHYAKRQITFFKKMPNINYIKPENVSLVAKRICENL